MSELENNLSDIVIDAELYNMKKESAFISIYDLVYPISADVDNDYWFEISPTSLLDNNCFAVSDGKMLELLLMN